MKKYLYDYIKSIDEVIEKREVNDEIIQEHLVKIKFFQHERFIHLLVTLFYTLFVLFFLVTTFFFIGFLLVFYILLIFLLFYVLHYFRLENGVQYLYKQYDIMIGKKNKY